MRRWAIGLFGFLLGSLGSVTILAQPFPTPIAQAIALLTSGTTPFAIVGVDASGYINFDTGRSATGYGIRDLAGVMQFKDSGGSWTNIASAGGAPTTATYITQTPDSGLSAEQPLSALASALLLNTTTTGVLSAYTGTTCTNQFTRALSALGVATCASVSLTADVTGTLPVANGGTGATTLTGLLVGSGTSAVSAITSSTTGQVPRVTGANTFAFGALSLSTAAAITGTLPVGNGGTGITTGTSGGILAFTAAGTIASSGALTANRIVLGGGAGVAPTVLGSLGTATTVLHGNAGGAPTFAAVDLSTDVTGALGVANGATGISSYTIGDVIYASGATTLSKLIDVSAGSFLRSGGVATAPAWSTTKWTNAATTGDLLYASASNQYANLSDVAAGSYLRSGGVTTAPVWSTTTLPNSATTGDLLYASASNVYSNLADVATGRVLSSGGVGVAPAWLTNPSSTTFEVSTAFIGPGTEATAGVIRLANTSTIAARNNGDSGNYTLLTSNASDQVVLGSTNAAGLKYTDGTRSLFWQTAAPTISSGFGTAPSIAGNDSAFKVTVGAGGDTTGVVLFNQTWSTAPVCMVQDETTSSHRLSPQPTTTQITIDGTTSASDVLAVMCIGY